MKNTARLYRLITAKLKPCSSSNLSHLIAILMFLALAVTPVFSHPGDALMGTILGTVRTIGADGQNHNAPGAKVRLESTAQTSSLFALADNSGEFKFGSVPAGSYKLEVAVEGFEDAARIITIHGGETAVEYIKLGVKSIHEAVTKNATLDPVTPGDAKTASELKQENLQTIAFVKYASQFRKLTLGFEGPPYTRSDIINPSANARFVNDRSETVHLPGFPSLQMRVLKSNLRFSASPKFSSRMNYFYPRDFRGKVDTINFGSFSSCVGRTFGIRLVIEKK